MVQIQNISEIHHTLGFTEFNTLEQYRKTFKDKDAQARYVQAY